jgi:Putative transposase
VQGAERVLEYLGRYVHRSALGESALVASDERGVTFRYRDSRDQRQKTMTLPGSEFLRRFLQHVPPKGFHRVRAFGLLHPHRRNELKRLQLLLANKTKTEPAERSAAPPKHKLRCPSCGQPSLRLLQRLSYADCLARAAASSPIPSPIIAAARVPPASADHVTAQVAS